MDDAHGVHDYVYDERNADILVSINGELKHRDQATVSVFESGYLLGDGVWEGMRVHGGGVAFCVAEAGELEEVCRLIDMDGMDVDGRDALAHPTTPLHLAAKYGHAEVVRALLDEEPEHLYHAAMMDPHTGAELDLDQIWALVDELLAAHGDLMPPFARVGGRTGISNQASASA